jgi:ferric-dicitrate binding protein FerR (iron transport regulator)
VTAGLVLLTAAAVLEGYRWLQVIPSSRLPPSAAVFMALVVPSTLLLARPPRPWRRSPAQIVALGAAVGLVVVTVVETVAGRPWSADLLGAYDLATAAAILTAALSGAGALDR